MLFKARSAAVYGIDAHIIDVEVDFSGIKLDQETFATVGLPDAAAPRPGLAPCKTCERGEGRAVGPLCCQDLANCSIKRRSFTKLA